MLLPACGSCGYELPLINSYTDFAKAHPSNLREAENI